MKAQDSTVSVPFPFLEGTCRAPILILQLTSLYTFYIVCKHLMQTPFTTKITFVLSILLCYSTIALAEQDYQELRIISAPAAKHIFLFTNVTNETRLKQIGESYQSRFPQDFIIVYFCDNKEKAPKKIPSPFKPSDWDTITFTYQSNRSTGSGDLIEQRSLTTELKKTSPPIQGKTEAEKEFARLFYQRNKQKGIISVNVYHPFMDITVDKKTSKRLLTHRAETTQLLNSWYKDFEDFQTRNNQNTLFLYVRILMQGDEIIVLHNGKITFY